MRGKRRGGAAQPAFPAATVLLTTDEMRRADRATIEAGVPGERLMEAAGQAVAQAVFERWQQRPVIVLCGPGNNGGDGFVAARLLQDAGWPVRVALLGRREALKGDARLNADRWDGGVAPLGPAALDDASLVVDAIFGAGLTRPLTGDARATVEAIGVRGLPCIAVDVPSGIDGDSGAVLGAAPRAEVTVTFFRAKPGHFLYPGRDRCGELVVADIGIPERVLERVQPRQTMNDPRLWGDAFPWPRWDHHKYSRGHALVAGGGEMTGAARLAAQAARRTGAGVVTVLAPPEAVDIYRSSLTGALVARVESEDDFAAHVADPRASALLVGPGNGVDGHTRRRVLTSLATGKPVVLDADALSVFADRPADLFGAIKGPCLLTPHEGEFARIFPDLGVETDRLRRTREAAVRAGAFVLLKGPDTTITGPDGRLAINVNGPPTLATAGSGDVLAGIAVGLLAQGMRPFEGACCAAWLHGEAARRFGPGMIAEDLIDGLPAVLAALAERGVDGG